MHRFTCVEKKLVKHQKVSKYFENNCEFTYSAGAALTKNKERIRKFKEIGGSWYVYQNGLYKACFQYGITYGDFKDLPRRAASDKTLRDKAFDIAKN